MTDELRLPAVAARLVAWHNRHPLACRIAAAQVHGIGYLALPFVDVAKNAQATAAETAPPAAAAALPALQPDFSEDIVEPLRPRAVARFAAHAGQVLPQPPGGGPTRQAQADGAHPSRTTVMVYLLTAVIETGTRRSRVLLGSGPSAPVLGRRIWSTPRLAAVVALAALMVGGPGWWLQRNPSAPAPDAVAAAPAALAPASSASAAVAAAEAAPAHDAAARVAPPAPPVYRHSSPRVVGPRPGAVAAIRPLISEEDKARARQARADLPQRVAPAPAQRPPLARPVPAAHAAPLPPAPPAPPSVAAPRVEPAFALTTRVLRTRAEADQVLVAMRSLLRSARGVKVEVLAQGDDWRVVGWPFARRADADKARALLVSRGMRVEVVGF